MVMSFSNIRSRIELGNQACHGIVQHTLGRVVPLLGSENSKAAHDLQIWIGEMLA